MFKLFFKKNFENQSLLWLFFFMVNEQDRN